MKRSRETTTYVCMSCGEEMSLDIARRSRTWAYGLVGVRAILCSIECRDEYDKSNQKVLS